jgi:phosphoribosylglycinamide formyltransferase-1
MTTRFGVLVSGSGTNLAALIDAAARSDVAAEIAVVISNKADAHGLERARVAGIRAVHISHHGKDRSSFDQEMVDCLVEHDVGWVLLAGFMRMVTPTLLDGFPGRVINIHPALLPSFPGIQGQRQAFEANVPISGATVHFVSAEMDAGPIIAQGAVLRVDGDTLESLTDRILAIEHRLFPMVMGWAAAGRLRLEGGVAVVDLKEGECRGLWGAQSSLPLGPDPVH